MAEELKILVGPPAPAPSQGLRHLTCIGSILALGALALIGTIAKQQQYEDGWPHQAEILKQMALYQKVRLLNSLDDQELVGKEVNVLRLPALGPAFWRQREMKQMARRLGFSTEVKDGELTITKESSRVEFIRVSKCLCDVSLIALKLMSALLSLEASIHVCELPIAAGYERVWLGNRLRRLAFNVPAASTSTNAQMSCASQINGIVSSFFAVSQYVSDSVYTCPPPNEVKDKEKAQCSMGVSVLVSGVEKSAAALSDIAMECVDPMSGDVPYARDIKAGRNQVVLAACLNNIGQAMSYIGKIGYQLNALATAPGVCPEYPSAYERYVCTENIGSLLADLGQVATYLSAAASGCGRRILLPFSCSSRLAATITGLFDVVQGVGATLAWCAPPGWLEKNLTAQASALEEKLHDAQYTHTFPLH